MKTLADPGNALARGLTAIRQEFQVPAAFPPEVLAAAEVAAKRAPTEHLDRTSLPFVTLDPASSTDLDQALYIEASGTDLLLHYAIADVAWFVADGGPIDVEAWRRGETLYLPDGKAGLYPPVLAEGAASLLPSGPRPAVIFIVRVKPDGSVALDGAERGIIQSRAKLAYDRVTAADLPQGFGKLARRIQSAEAERGAARVDPPEQVLERHADSAYELAFRPHLQSEVDNAAMSLATNLAVAALMQANRTGLFRVMARPEKAAIHRLRLTAKALGIDWPTGVELDRFERTLKQHVPAHAALMLAIRRAGQGASYAPYREGVVPWHAAMAATYAHATAPLRRLADRYVVKAALALANGQAVPEPVGAAFERLPQVMARSGALAGRIDRAVLDLAEAVLLSGREGETFEAVVTEVVDKWAKVQLCDLPVRSRVAAGDVEPGELLRLELTDADPGKRAISFSQT